MSWSKSAGCVTGGADFAIEATGNPAVMRQSLACVRAQGGTAVIVGNAKQGQMLEIDPRELNQGKRLLGTWGGDNVPDRDYPRYGQLIAAGKLNVEPLLGRAVWAARRERRRSTTWNAACVPGRSSTSAAWQSRWFHNAN